MGQEVCARLSPMGFGLVTGTEISPMLRNVIGPGGTRPSYC
jgi:hypothetical protein